MPFGFRVAMAMAMLTPTPSALAQRSSVEANHGMVVSASHFASQAGVEILRQGGNAVDAAIATSLVLAVTYPRAGNLGGGGFMLVRLADGSATSIDYREVAPAAATKDLYLNANGELIPKASLVGHRAAGVPGTVAGMALAFERYGSGKVSWSDLVEPARRLSADGFPLTQALARDLKSNRRILDLYPETRRIFLRDGHPYEAGERFKQPELAATLERLQRLGARDFYQGETARMIAADMEANGGLITLADLANYRPVERQPVRGRYRDVEIMAMPPPSSGGIAMLQMLGMLEPYPLSEMPHHSADRFHLLAETMRRAYRDRAEYIGDPDFVSIPIAGLLEREYLAKRMENYNPQQATASRLLEAGIPSGRGPMALAESMETTHLSVVDSDGNVVANTYTINGLYGNGVTVPGAGFLLNNEMDDFTTRPGIPNAFGLVQGLANVIEPSKRPLSSMTPTVVLRNGKPLLILGSPGGSTIINTVLQVVLNVVDHGMTLAQAIEAPRIHHQWLPDALTHEPNGLSADTAERLRERGHTLTTRNLYWTQDDPLGARYLGDVAAIMIDPKTGKRFGMADPRSPDALAAGF
jgi:gamma-glutamyltranspeptidase / glutathione hydrolase